jgi:hypothetical protein
VDQPAARSSSLTFIVILVTNEHSRILVVIAQHRSGSGSRSLSFSRDARTARSWLSALSSDAGLISRDIKEGGLDLRELLRRHDAQSNSRGSQAVIKTIDPTCSSVPVGRALRTTLTMILTPKGNVLPLSSVSS